VKPKAKKVKEPNFLDISSSNIIIPHNIPKPSHPPSPTFDLDDDLPVPSGEEPPWSLVVSSSSPSSSRTSNRPSAAAPRPPIYSVHNLYGPLSNDDEADSSDLEIIPSPLDIIRRPQRAARDATVAKQLAGKKAPVPKAPNLKPTTVPAPLLVSQIPIGENKDDSPAPREEKSVITIPSDSDSDAEEIKALDQPNQRVPSVPQPIPIVTNPSRLPTVEEIANHPKLLKEVPLTCIQYFIEAPLKKKMPMNNTTGLYDGWNSPPRY